MMQCNYHTTDRGLRKVAARNNCRIEKTDAGWLVMDSVYGSVVDFDLNAEQVLALFN